MEPVRASDDLWKPRMQGNARHPTVLMQNRHTSAANLKFLQQLPH